MPSPPPDEEIDYVASEVAKLAIERAAGAVSLRGFAHDWWPDHDAIDQRDISRRLSERLAHLRGVLGNRQIRLESTGKMRKPQ